MKPDVYDVMVAVGLAMVGSGVALLWSIEAATLVLGVILVAVGFAGAWRKGAG